MDTDFAAHMVLGDDEVDGGMADGEVMDGALVRDLTITNKRGLHARASAKFVQTVETFTAEVEVTKDNQTVGGTSIMGLMMLAASPGTTIRVAARGPDAADALDAIALLVNNKFYEE